MIRSFLSRSPLYVLALYASVLIFLVYTCAYAYRKPFTAAIYEGEILWGFDVKILYVLSEIIGYALSKFIGVRILPSMKAGHRILYNRAAYFFRSCFVGFCTSSGSFEGVFYFSERSSPGYDLGCHF